MDLQFSQRCIINCELPSSFWNKIENCPFLRKMQSINICLILCKSEWGKRKKKRMNIWINIETFQQVPIKSYLLYNGEKWRIFYAQNKLLPGLFNWSSFLESSKGSLFLFSAFLHQSKHMKIDYILLFTNMMLQGLKMNKNFL